jgi:glyoxylase-like metal-dependent hydrolase (beta-lactamase superfamily II)
MKITEHIHALRMPFHVEDPSGNRIPRFVYVYIICGQQICLIDSGTKSSEKEIFGYLERLGRSPEEISLLILTHSHPDHIGAARAVQRASGCIVAAHAAERAWIEDVNLQFEKRPIPGFHSLVEGSVHVDRILEENDIVNVGNSLDLKVLHTPGHSSGSISLFSEQEGALFSADAIPIVGEMPIWEDPAASIKSIEKLLALEGIRILLSAWDDPRDGEDAYRKMEDGRRYLQRIHETVLRVGADPDLDFMELSQRVIRELGLPEAMANPLTARTFQASLRSGMTAK